MAVTVKVGSNPQTTNIEQYSVSEESTPLNAADNTGAVGQLNLSFPESSQRNDEILLGKTLYLSDYSNGMVTGTVTRVGATDGAASITADSRLGQLVPERTIKPFNGTLGDAFRYYLSLGKITTNIVVDPSLESRSVTYPGRYGSPWEFLKQICVVQRVEIALVSNAVVLRPARQRIAEVVNDISRGWEISNTQMAEAVEVYYYNNRYVDQALVYPYGGWNEEVQVYQVDANEVMEVEVALDGSLTSIMQPAPVDYVAKNYTGPTSVYSVSGNDGLPIKAAQWKAQKGKMTVAIQEDTQTLKITITGASEKKYAPYRIAVTSGANAYSSLRIMGTGVMFKKTLLRVPTGVPEALAVSEVGVQIDNPAISTFTDATTAGLAAAQKYAHPEQTISIQASVVNRKGEKGEVTYPVFNVFNTENNGKTFDTWNTEYTGQTFNAMTNEYFELVAGDFENQAFGNVGGARVLHKNAWYRVRSANISQNGIRYDAEFDTIMTDFNNRWSSGTFDDFNARQTGMTFDDWAVVPLW